MIIESQAADPRVHRAAVKMARQFVLIISGLLRDDERGLAMNEAYRVARDGLEEFREGR